MHHDPAAVAVRIDPQIASQRVPGHRNVAVVEIPAHHNHLRGDDDLVSTADGQSNPVAYFWLTGALSSFLDNAPTYLVFFNLAGGDAKEGEAHHA